MLERSAIMTLDNSTINVLLYTMPSTSKHIIACAIFDLYPLSYVTKKGQHVQNSSLLVWGILQLKYGTFA